MARERIPLTFEIEVGLEPATKDQRDRFVQPYRAEVLLGGQRTGAYAIAEGSIYGPPERELKDQLVQHATRSFIGRLNKALTTAQEN